MHLYYLSNTAYSGLAALGVEAGVLNPHARKPHGLSAFLDRLSEQEMIDNRSEYNRKIHARVKKANRWPQWRLMNGENRIPRCLYLTEEAINNYSIIAIKLGMLYTWKKRVAGQPKTTTSVTGWVLEAIGSGLILPVTLPLGKQGIDRVSHRAAEEVLHDSLPVGAGG